MPPPTREYPKPRPKPGGKFGPSKDKPTRQNAKYIHGVTVIDRSKGIGMVRKNGKEQELIPSLLRGEETCRECYEAQPCECGKPLFNSDVDVYWTASSPYMQLGFPAVRKLEDIAMDEARRLGMSCVVIRSDHHNTATEFNRTGRKTGRIIPADFHVTLSHGDSPQKLLLQGHCYLFVGKNKEVPQCKLAPGYRTILEPHEIIEKLSLEDAAVDVYWGINGSCGFVFNDSELPTTAG